MDTPPIPFAISSPVTVTPADTEIAVITLGGYYKTVSVQLSNAAGGATLTDFKVQLKAHPDAAWSDYLSGADWDSIDEPNMLSCSLTGPHELPAGQAADVAIRVNGAHAIRFSATVAALTAAVMLRGTASPV